jgi:RNA polymerase sigma factor (sigma-70 family)
MSKETVDVETIDILLLGDKEEIAEAIRLIHFHFREKIIWIIRKIAISADIHDLSDIYQDIMLSILECAANRNYNPDAQKLEGFIYKITYCRAIDWLRERKAIKEEHSTDSIIESAQMTICNSKYNESWQKAQAEGKRNLILKTINNLVPTLKHRQRQVAEIIRINFPDFLSDSKIKEQILYRYGEDITTLAVKSARQEVYSKIREALSIAGYGDYTDE